MIKVDNLEFSYTDEPLYKGVSFIVGDGQKIGLVGPNGSGKSTLLKMLLGEETGYKGKIVVTGIVGYVPQEVKNDPQIEKSNTVREYVDPQSTYLSHELMKMFTNLGLDVGLSDDPTKFSGGQKTKLALARSLLLHPDVLLLDEPTNFMDSDGKKWVMDFLARYEGTVLVISHDLKLMDNAIDKILAIDPLSKLITEYTGNYTKYLKLKSERENLLKRQILIKKKHIEKMEKGLQKMVRFTSAKGVRAKVRQRRRIEKEKAMLPPSPTELRYIKVTLPEPAKVGELPIRMVNVSKFYGENVVLDNVTLSVRRGERIALIGKNGAGKSTLIKIVVGLIKPDSGDIILNPQVKLGYYSQEFETFDMNSLVIDTFVEKTKKDESYARAFLGRFLFSREKVFQRIESLSGGEKTRLSIAILTATDNNLLVLDEPTTYLDPLSQRIILDTIKEYKGTILIVSHTEDFIDELKPDRAYLLPECKAVYWDDDLLSRTSEI